MVSDVMPLLRESMAFAVSQTERLIDALGAQGILLYTFIVYSTYRFFLKPLLGGAGSSDFASRRYIGKGNSSSAPKKTSDSKDLSV